MTLPAASAGGSEGSPIADAELGPPASVDVGALAGRIDAALPQTQCRRCGYPDCRAYADAIAQGDAAINRCPPGGADGIARLAAITGRPFIALDPACGREAPRGVAVIDEGWCIGCALCLKACPVDCIVGGAKVMHTVIETECTGCELCIPACPVDCIAMVGVTGERSGWAAWSPDQADVARARYAAHRQRQLGAASGISPDPAPRGSAPAAAQPPGVPPLLARTAVTCSSDAPPLLPDSGARAAGSVTCDGPPDADVLRRERVAAALARAKVTTRR